MININRIARLLAFIGTTAIGLYAEPGAERAFAREIRFSGNDAAAGLTTGSVRPESFTTEMGAYREAQAGLTFEGRGASATFQIPAPPQDQPLFLEIQEIHQRRSQAFGYRVIVGSQPVYFRTYEERGAGPNHYWIQVPAEAYAGRKLVNLTFRSEGSAPFTLGAVWVYHDFFKRVAAPEKVYRPMGLLGMELADIEPKPSFTSFAPIGRLSIAQYGAAPVDRGRTRFVEGLQAGAAAGEQILWMPNGTAWGGKPNGPDGRGGYFSDPRYSSLGYSPDTGRYLTSWPGMWGSTAWPSLHEPWMNQFLETRFQSLFTGLTTEMDFLTARGQRPHLGVIREWGLSSCELSPSSIEKAAAAGLRLDPADGLDTNERSWMFRDGVRLWQDYAASTRRALARASVQIDRGTVRLPDRQVLDELYSQPDFLSDWAVGPELWSIGEQGMVPGFWSSGELGQGKEYRELATYDYLRARGRLAMVNLERTILKEDFRVLRDHYARGFQFVTLFNDTRKDAPFIQAVDHCEDAPALPAIHRETSLLAIDFRHLKALGPDDALAGHDNIQIAHAKTFKLREHRAPRLTVLDHRHPGQITYRLQQGGAPFTNGLSLHLNGRISSVGGNAIELWAGRAPDQLRLLRNLRSRELPCPDHWAMHMTSDATIDLGADMVGASEWFFRLVIHSPSATDAAFLLGLDVGSQWPQRSGYLAGNPLKARDERTLQLWVQDRAPALSMLETYARTALGAAGQETPAPSAPTLAWNLAVPGVPAREQELFTRSLELYRQGWYRSAYGMLVGELSQILPARYAVRGGGALGCHPVEVSLPSADAVAVVRLESVGPDGATFSLTSEKPAAGLVLRFPGLDSRTRTWTLETTSPSNYRLRPSSSGSAQTGTVRAISTGGVEVELDATPPAPVPKATLPRTLEGRYLQGDRKRLTIDTQDLAAMNQEASMEIPVAESVTFERKADLLFASAEDEARWPKPLDAVTLTLDPAGRVIAIKARYGRDRGRIRAFHTPTLVGDLSPGGIELENGRRYDFSYTPGIGTIFSTVALHAGITNYEIRALEQALRPGQEVDLTYCPYATTGSHPRLRTVSAPHRVLISEDFTQTTGDEWKVRAFRIDGVDVQPHKPEPNYLYDVVIRLLRPTGFFQPGNVVYKVEQDQPLGTTALEFAARAFEDSSIVAFSVSADGDTWTPVGQFDNTWQNNYPQSTDSKSWRFPPQMVDMTNAVKGLHSFYLKIALSVGDADERFCFGGFRVITEAPANP